MYHFSRAIYRELAPFVLKERPSAQSESNRSIVLRQCESAIERLITDRRYFARLAVLAAEHGLERFLAAVPDYAFDSHGVPRRCQAMTRKGQPCQRQPLTASEYCPSHQHLTESFEDLGLVELAA